MEQKLTAQICAKYWGAKVYDNEFDFVGIMTELGDDYISIFHHHYAFKHRYNKCKLGLKPLTKISDDDAAEIAKMFNGKKAYYQDRFLQICDDKGIVDFYCILDNDFKIPIKLIDYLRSKHYDCDGLIEAGLAIEDTEK